MIDLETDLSALLLETIDTPVEQDILKLAAQIYCRQQDWDKALAMLELVKDQDAGFKVCQIQCLLGLGQKERAQDLITASLENYPHDVSLLTMQAAALISIENYECAVEYCYKLLDNAPNNLKGFLILAEAYLCQEKWQLALDTLEEAESKCGQLGMIGENLRGAAAGQLGQHEIASLAFAKAVSYEENFYSGWFNLATALFRLERNEEAEMALARIPQWMLEQIVTESNNDKAPEVAEVSEVV